MNADLLSHFSTLTDPRVDRTKRYPLIELIFLIISATVSGCVRFHMIFTRKMMQDMVVLNNANAGLSIHMNMLIVFQI